MALQVLGNTFRPAVFSVWRALGRVTATAPCLYHRHRFLEHRVARPPALTVEYGPAGFAPKVKAPRSVHRRLEQ